MGKHVAVSCANGTNFKTLVSVNESSGVLKSIGVSAGRSEHLFKIDIDGTTIHDGYSPNSSNNYFTDAARGQKVNNGLGIDFQFKESLDIEIRDGQYAYTTPRYWAVYQRSALQQGQEDGGGTSTENSGEVVDERIYPEDSFIYEKNLISYPDQEENAVVKTLLGNEYLSSVSLYNANPTDENIDPVDVHSKGEDIYLAITLQDWKGNDLLMGRDWRDNNPLANVDEFKFVVRIPGRREPIHEFYIGRDQIQEDGSISDMGFSLDQKGDFEIATDLPGYGNVPFQFTVY